MNLNHNLLSRGFALGISRFTAGLGMGLLLLGPSFPAAAQSTNGPSRPDFSAFKLITDRNIFDPRRSPRRSRSSRSEAGPSYRAEYFALVGIMNYDAQGPIAFFDGTSSQYQKVLKPNDSIAGYKVARIEPASVKLSVGSNEFQLPLGMQVRRDSEGKWQLAESAEAPSSRSDRPSDRASLARGTPALAGPRPAPPALVTNTAPGTAVAEADSQQVAGDVPPEMGGPGAPPEAAPGPGGETDPVLLRLMQRRAQEAGQ